MPDELHVIRWGAGEPAVLVHGSFGWGEETWLEQRQLADAYELVLVDRRGFGLTPPPDGRVDFDSDADDIAEILDQHGRAHLVGHSYGGIVALLAAARRPGAVRSLCVIEPPAVGLVRGRRHIEEFIDRVGDAADNASDAEDYHARFLAAFGFPPPRERLSRESLSAALSSWAERPPWEAEIPLDELAETSFPKLVVRGVWDQAPEEARRRGAAAFAAVCDVLVERLHAESAEFAGAAHNPQLLGAPFNDRLRAFWKSAP